MVGGWGERLVEHSTFQNQNTVRELLYHCISDGNRLSSENVGSHFNFILHVMSDKAGLCFNVFKYNGTFNVFFSF